MCRITGTYLYTPYGADCLPETDDDARRLYPASGAVREPYYASRFASTELGTATPDFDHLLRNIIRGIVEKYDVDTSDEGLQVVVSTTKANVARLANADNSLDIPTPYASVSAIIAESGFRRAPIIASNACISGVSAIVTAAKLIAVGDCRRAIVIGADMLCDFIITGFQSFKALSPEGCRPFDANRIGLNLGEGGGALILEADTPDTTQAGWQIEAYSVTNDANHISAPSRTAEGAVAALEAVMRGVSPADIGTICLHGTSSLYNDEMEALALHRTGLDKVPANSLKSYFGHTLGGAGVIETIVTMRTLEKGYILPTRGMETQGTTHAVSVCNRQQAVSTQRFIKLLSGFGGTNSAIRIAYTDASTSQQVGLPQVNVLHRVEITPDMALIDDTPVATASTGKAMLTELYRSYDGAWPKFFKMDMLERLAFVASAMLLDSEGGAAAVASPTPEDNAYRNDRAVIFFNSYSSLHADALHQSSINEANNLASPSVFVYTLPNLAAAEVAIRRHYRAEASHYLLREENWAEMHRLASLAAVGAPLTSAIIGWVEYLPDDSYRASLQLISFS